jgi:hypothetical protein
MWEENNDKQMDIFVLKMDYVINDKKMGRPILKSRWLYISSPALLVLVPTSTNG